jgi:4-hydroxybenzoate polyprenyltransferase
VKSKPAGGIRRWLVLGRVSNLPTVWSNCLAAWLVGGGGSALRLGIAALGGSLLYTGGMFLNDAFDAEFDGKHRPERPVPSGAVKRRTVWICGGALLIAGCAVQLPLGPVPAALALGLAAAIVIYDAVHKHTSAAPVLMGGCRYLLYLMAAASSEGGLGVLVQWRALALAAYVCGLSSLAQVESNRGAVRYWPLALLPAPLLPLLGVSAGKGLAAGVIGLALVVWVGLALRRALAGADRNIGAGVARLLAGIVLVDWVGAAAVVPGNGSAFLGLFVLALLTQRVAPAS